MIVTLKTQGLQTLEQIRAFLAGSAPLSFAAPQREAAYGLPVPRRVECELAAPGGAGLRGVYHRAC
jgi:hypothetical protein